MANFKKKPTVKELANVTIEINKKVNELGEATNQAFSVIRQLDAIVGMYVEFNNDGPKFNEFITEKQEELKKLNDAKADGKADKPNLQEDTEDEGSGTEGVREKE